MCLLTFKNKLLNTFSCYNLICNHMEQALLSSMFCGTLLSGVQGSAEQHTLRYSATELRRQCSAAYLEVLPHASHIPWCEGRVLLLMLLRGRLCSCSSPLGLGLGHEVPQGEIAPRPGNISVIASLVLVLQMLSQGGVVSETLAACQAMHDACARQAFLGLKNCCESQFVGGARH